jgi:histidyl-tRNA synthetase
MKPIRLDGQSLTRDQLVAIACGASVGLDPGALKAVARAAGLNVETQLEPRKLAKQLQYADKAGIRFVAIRGEDEAARGTVAVKDLRRGEQFEANDAEIANALLKAKETGHA